MASSSSSSSCSVEQESLPPPPPPPFFKQFDVVSDFSDHLYYAADEKPMIIHGGAAHKKIMQEWRVLEHSLPDSIYVRAYDTRIDLMRAVIVGAKGTPYHDGLYFFDIRFPPDYPLKPPKVGYRSHGMRINPNLYASGYVCLSLLNTWRGTEMEMWDPKASTVLQILVSIQGLVLNERPYFNEPMGNGGWQRTETTSRVYSERVFLLACKTAAFALRNKPRNFEGFVVEHFGERGGGILRACAAYAGGCVRVGCYGEDGCDLASRGEYVSEEFREALREVYEMLVEAFKENSIFVGADVDDFSKLVSSEKAAFCGRKSGVLRRMVEKFRNGLVAKKKKKEYDKNVKLIGFLFSDIGVID